MNSIILGLKNWKTSIGAVGIVLMAAAVLLGWEPDAAKLEGFLPQVALVLGLLMRVFADISARDVDKTDDGKPIIGREKYHNTHV